MNINGVEQDVKAIFADAAAALPKLEPAFSLIAHFVPGPAGLVATKILAGANALIAAAPALEQDFAALEQHLQPVLVAFGIETDPPV